MFKTIRVAGLAAAAALLCAANSASAQTAATTTPPVSPADHAAAATPATVIDPAASAGDLPATSMSVAATSAPVVPTPIAAPTPVIDHSTADAALTPRRTLSDRTRPDRQVTVTRAATPITPAVPGLGVTAVARADRNLDDLVAQHAAADTTDEEFACLASAVYFESRGEPLEGQLAVAEVILNRVRSGRFRGTICDVVKQPSQFSFVRRGVIPDAPRHSTAWHRAVAIAHIALNDLHDVTGEESLFFHATYVNPRWGRPRIARIGNHIFYR